MMYGRHREQIVKMWFKFCDDNCHDKTIDWDGEAKKYLRWMKKAKRYDLVESLAQLLLVSGVLCLFIGVVRWMNVS